MLVVDLLREDPNNPRTEFPEGELKELVEDIRQHGILQPIVVHPADEQGRHRIHFGAKRWRAAQRAGLTEVPVVVRDAQTDPYTQVAENQKRHGLTPLDLAHFIRARVDAGDSNATVAKRLGIDQTTVAHHLALLELPPELNEAMQAGRCTSPRTLYELNKLHRDEPDRVRALLASDGDITSRNVNVARTESIPTAHAPSRRRAQPPLLAQADAAFARLELVLGRIAKAEPRVADASQLARQALAETLDDTSAAVPIPGSDSQTPGRTVTKVMLRMPRAHAERLVLNAVALGLSYGEYVARLVERSRLPQPIIEREADRAALLASNDQLAALSADLNALVRSVSQGSGDRERESSVSYRA